MWIVKVGQSDFSPLMLTSDAAWMQDTSHSTAYGHTVFELPIEPWIICVLQLKKHAKRCNWSLTSAWERSQKCCTSATNIHSRLSENKRFHLISLQHREAVANGCPSIWESSFLENTLANWPLASSVQESCTPSCWRFSSQHVKIHKSFVAHRMFVYLLWGLLSPLLRSISIHPGSGLLPSRLLTTSLRKYPTYSWLLIYFCNYLIERPSNSQAGQSSCNR